MRGHSSTRSHVPVGPRMCRSQKNARGAAGSRHHGRWHHACFSGQEASGETMQLLAEVPLAEGRVQANTNVSVQFSYCHVRLCDPLNRSTPGLPVHHQRPEFTQTPVHRVSDAIQPSHPLVPFSSCPQSLPASGSFQMSQLFASGGQSTGVSASASVFPMNTQD